MAPLLTADSFSILILILVHQIFLHLWLTLNNWGIPNMAETNGKSFSQADPNYWHTIVSLDNVATLTDVMSSINIGPGTSPIEQMPLE